MLVVRYFDVSAQPHSQSTPISASARPPARSCHQRSPHPDINSPALFTRNDAGVQKCRVGNTASANGNAAISEPEFWFARMVQDCL